MLPPALQIGYLGLNTISQPNHTKKKNPTVYPLLRRLQTLPQLPFWNDDINITGDHPSHTSYKNFRQKKIEELFLLLKGIKRYILHSKVSIQTECWL